MILNNTSVDSIAIWTPTTFQTLNTIAGIPIDFTKPILLSTAVGIQQFFNIDPPPPEVITKAAQNTVYSIMRRVVLSGHVTFNSSSTALVALRGILDAQRSLGKTISGVGIIVNPSALLITQYPQMTWVTPDPTPNRNKVLSDITLSFTCTQPKTISLGSIAAANNILAGLGLV